MRPTRYLDRRCAFRSACSCRTFMSNVMQDIDTLRRTCVCFTAYPAHALNGSLLSRKQSRHCHWPTIGRTNTIHQSWKYSSTLRWFSFFKVFHGIACLSVYPNNQVVQSLPNFYRRYAIWCTGEMPNWWNFALVFVMQWVCGWRLGCWYVATKQLLSSDIDRSVLFTMMCHLHLLDGSDIVDHTP